MESFETFTTNELLLSELNPYGKKRKFKKEDAAYGMWAEHDSDEEDKGERSGENFKLKMENDDCISMLPFMTAGTAPPAKRKKELPLPVKIDKSGKQQKPGRPGNNAESDKDFCEWEKHTTRFGSRILAKMGYKSGEGLGSSGGGIVNPVKVVNYTSFIKNSKQLSYKPLGNVEDYGKEERSAPTRRWKKSNMALGNSKSKYTCKTINELLAQSNRQQIREHKTLKLNNNVKVIDLTVKEKETFGCYDEKLTKPNEKLEEEEYLPELLYNIGVLVENIEDEIVNNDKKLRIAQHQLMFLEDDELSKVENERQMHVVTDLIDIVNMFENRVNSNTVTLQQCEALVISLKEKYPHEYRLYQLSTLVYVAIAPQIQSIVAQWDMLGDPSNATLKELFTKWKSLLAEDKILPTMIPVFLIQTP